MNAKAWAQRRNFMKYKLAGILSHLNGISNDSVATQVERHNAIEANKYIRKILRLWDIKTPISKKLNIKKGD